jgi:hypothetical protein
MRSLEPPDTRLGRGPWWILVAAILVAGVATWYLAHREASPPARRGAGGSVGAPSASPTAGARSPGTPTSANDDAVETERLSRNGTAGRGAAPKSGRAAESSRSGTTRATRPAVAPRELRVTADVDGAYVFLDRKFLGSTPLVSRDVSPGTHQLNVQMEGRPPVVRTVDIAADGPTEVSVSLAAPPRAAAQFSAAVAVVHQHGVGSCEGTLRASGDGFRYETPHKDAFSLPFGGVETFAVEYTEKRLRLKQRGGRTWNFTTRADNADPLFVFHRDVEAVRQP